MERLTYQNLESTASPQSPEEHLAQSHEFGDKTPGETGGRLRPFSLEIDELINMAPPIIGR